MNTASDSFTSEAQMPAMSGTPGAVPRDPVIVSRKHSAAVVLSVLLGGLGIDRMYTGRVALGILKLLFGWLTFGIWPIVDVILMGSGKARDGTGTPLIAYDDGNPSQPRPGESPPQPATASHKHFVAVVLSVLLGVLGIDRMYTGRVGLGILKLITLGGVFVWWIVDMCLMGMGSARDGNGNPLISYH